MKQAIIFLASMLIMLTVAATEPDTTQLGKLSEINDKEKVEMNVEGFSEYAGSSYAIFLKEVDSKENVYLPIIIGECEAVSLSREMSEVEIGRPLTYHLFGNLLNEAKIDLREVIITEIKNNTFYAVIVFAQGDKRWEIDARPSDAMNLAVRMKSKVFTYRKVIEEAGQELKE